MDLKEQELLGKDAGQHWYYQAKSELLAKLVGNTKEFKILDVGAGSCFFSRFLLQNELAVEATCIDPNFQDTDNEIINGKNLVKFKSVKKSDADIVIMMDILEHIGDDVALLREYVSKVDRGAVFVITVPAFMFLWSEHDNYLEHKRRYTLEMLKKTVHQAGLVPEKSFYFYSFVFPIALLLRLLNKWLTLGGKGSQLKKHSKITNWFLRNVCSFELKLPVFKYLFGLSVVCVCRKTV